MKTSVPRPRCLANAVLFLASFSCLTGVAIAQNQSVPVAVVPQAETAPYAVVERGPHHKRVAHTLTLTNALGKVSYRTNGYTEIADGMNHLAGNQWVESTEEIQITANGGQATNSAHQVIFAANANSPAAIQLVTPEGKQLSSHVVALSYFDPSTGNSALISQLQDSVGQLVSSNEVIYPNALGGDCEADIFYHFSIAGLEQNIILRQQPPSPEAYNLSSAGTWLQVTTEFIDAPTPALVTNAFDSTSQGAALDQLIDFGIMQIGRGKAFLIGDTPPDSQSVNVLKQWVVQDGRTFLLELVPLTPSMTDQLKTLPPPTSPSGTNGNGGNGAGAMLRQDGKSTLSKRVLVPPMHFSHASAASLQLARSDLPSRRGFLIDYAMLATQTNFTAKADTTYYISGNVTLRGTNTFEGGAVLKYATNSSLSLLPSSIPLRVNWLGSQYRPVVLTAQDDNTVGETLTNSSGTPSGYYANPALYITAPTGGLNMPGFRIAYAKQAVSLSGMSPIISSGQIINCGNGMTIQGGGATIENVLFANVATNFNNVQAGGFTCQNVTFSSSGYLVALGSAADTNTATFTLNNCIFASVTNLYNFNYTSITGGHNGFYNSATFGSSTFTTGTYPFQTVGAAGFYLAEGSLFRKVGTASIDTNLLAGLAKRTTYPPIVFFGAGQIYPTNDLILSPQARRDTNGSPDLGYHYDPIDFAFGACFTTNNITVQPGTAIGMFCTNFGVGQGLYGLILDGASQFACQGTPTSPNWIFRYNTVQEQSNTNWSVGVGPCLARDPFYAPGPSINCRFTDFSVLAMDAATFWIQGTSFGLRPPANFRDCQVFGGVFGCNAAATFNLTNCLFDRVDVEMPSDGINVPIVRNNLFHGGTFDFDPYPITNALVADNLFDQTTNWDNSWDYGTYSGGHNAYVTNAFITNNFLLNPTNAGDLVLNGSPSYQTGPLGSYYYPSNLTSLINAGSTTADLVALYHYTTTTNQMKETNSLVDIGYHYVAVTNGVPMDSDGDGVWDYLEDVNGNGLYDSGSELLSWLNASTSGTNDYLLYIEGRNLGVTATPVADTTGVTGLNVYTPLQP